MSDKYILQGKTPIPADLMTWARWFETADRHVAKDEIGDVRISTVFLGLDHTEDFIRTETNLNDLFTIAKQPARTHNAPIRFVIFSSYGNDSVALIQWTHERAAPALFSTRKAARVQYEEVRKIQLIDVTKKRPRR